MRIGVHQTLLSTPTYSKEIKIHSFTVQIFVESLIYMRSAEDTEIRKG